MAILRNVYSAVQIPYASAKPQTNAYMCGGMENVMKIPLIVFEDYHKKLLVS